MACTYYGGATGQFTLDIARLGLIPVKDDMVAENSYVFGNHGGSKKRWDRFYGDGHRVVLCNSYQQISPTMTVADAEQRYHRMHLVIDTDFLARCKLLDPQVFERELKSSPSPVAMAMAIRAAKESIKPDYARTRKYGAGLADAVEALLYHDLVESEKEAGNTHWDVFYRSKALNVGFGFLGNEALCLTPMTANGIASKALNDPNGFNSGISLDYLAAMGLIDLDLYRVLEGQQPKPLALQSALRWKLGFYTVDTSTLDLPAGVFDA